MANFPTSLPGLKNDFDSADPIASADQNDQANEVNAIGAKVGIDSSAVTTSHDYKLSGVTGTDKAVSKTGTETLTNKTFTSPVLNTGLSGTAFLDEDTMSSNSATKAASQQSIKAYVDTHAADTSTHGVATVADAADLTTHESDTTTHGATGAVVGTTNTQQLSNKTHNGDFGLVGATDNITVASADPWRTITLMPGLLKPTTTSGCAAQATIEAGTNDIDYDVLDFDTTTDENAFANFQMPDSWNAGVIQFRYIWTNASGSAAQTVTFELSGISYADSDAIDAAVGTAVEVADTWLAQGDVHISAWSSNVTLAGTPAAGEYVHVEIMRDVSQDDLTGDARLIAVQIRYRQAQYTD